MDERTFLGLLLDGDNKDRLLLVLCWQQWSVVVGGWLATMVGSH